ncbi:MAG: hypothetical protein KGL39_35985 [Patescibacteria group bacterium]|nr:hypothetical protein [Patescibacteria group bacterium]
MAAPEKNSQVSQQHSNTFLISWVRRDPLTVARSIQMALIAQGSNKEFKLTPEGTHMAVCHRVIDLGTQRWEYQGEPQIGRKVHIGWELHGEADDGTPLTTEDGKPLGVSKEYTLSLGKKANLRADIESWRGKAFTDQELAGFDISVLLGQPCMVTIKHTKKGDKTYTNIATVSKFPAALKNAKPSATNPLQLFDVSAFDDSIYQALPEWIRKKIDASAERSTPKTQTMSRAATPQGSGFDDMDNDIPF